MPTSTPQRWLQIHPRDNVMVALQLLKKGETIPWYDGKIVLQEDIPAKHKFMLTDLKTGDNMIMYGVLIGKAQQFIPKGGLMKTENTKHAADPYAFRNVKYSWEAPDVSKFQHRTFNGYQRSDGRVGTANYWLFIPTVF